jgi:hypothetical protein
VIPHPSRLAGHNTWLDAQAFGQRLHLELGSLSEQGDVDYFDGRL